MPVHRIISIPAPKTLLKYLLKQYLFCVRNHDITLLFLSIFPMDERISPFNSEQHFQILNYFQMELASGSEDNYRKLKSIIINTS